MKNRKPYFAAITVLAFVLTVLAAMQLRSGLQTQFAVMGWGFVLIFGCINFVRGIQRLNRSK